MSTDVLPTEPTVRDFHRLGAKVSIARFHADPESVWSPDAAAEQCWESRDLMPFPILAHHALAVARDQRFKSPEDIYRIAAGVIEP
jgi:hypothetical protein